MALFKRMFLEGCHILEIATACAVDHNRIKRLCIDMAEEHKAVRHSAIVARRTREGTAHGYVRPADEPPLHAIQDREARASILPRDLTAFLLGDPKPGYSALERSREAV